MHHCHIFPSSCSPAANCELPLFSYHTVSHIGQKSTKKSLLLFGIISTCRFLKKWALLKGQHCPSDILIMTYYGITLTAVSLYVLILAIINHHQELHIFLPYEYCIRSGIHPDPTKIFFYFLLPVTIIFFVTLFFDSNIWQRPYSTHVNIKDIYDAIFTQISIKSYALTFLIIIVTLFPLLVSKWLQLSVTTEGLLFFSLFLPLLIVKGPCIAYWTFQTEAKNLEEAKRNLMLMEIELQPVDTNLLRASSKSTPTSIEVKEVL